MGVLDVVLHALRLSYTRQRFGVRAPRLAD